MSHNSQGGFFLIIPAYIADDPDLCPGAKLFFGRLAQLTSQQGYCWASNEYLANLCQVSPREIRRWLLKLKEKNYISIEMTEKDRRIFTTLSTFKKSTTVDKNVQGGGQKCPTNKETEQVKEKKHTKKMPTDVGTADASHRLARAFLSLQQEKMPLYKGSCHHVKNMQNLLDDGYTEERLLALMKWALNDHDFWLSRCLHPRHFERQIETIAAQFDQKQAKDRKTEPNTAKEALRAENLSKAKEIAKSYERYGITYDEHQITIANCLKRGKGAIIIPLETIDFDQLVENALKQKGIK